MTFVEPDPRKGEAPPTAAEERSWLHSTAFWAVLGGISSLLTGVTTIAAVVVGGTSITGGAGGIGRTVVGALIISVVRVGMTFVGVDIFGHQQR